MPSTPAYSAICVSSIDALVPFVPVPAITVARPATCSTTKWNKSRFSSTVKVALSRSEEHTSELQSRFDLVCLLLLEKKNQLYFLRSDFAKCKGAVYTA